MTVRILLRAYRDGWIDLIASSGTDQFFLAEWQLFQQGTPKNATIIAPAQTADASVDMAAC